MCFDHCVLLTRKFDSDYKNMLRNNLIESLVNNTEYATKATLVHIGTYSYAKLTCISRKWVCSMYGGMTYAWTGDKLILNMQADPET